MYYRKDKNNSMGTSKDDETVKYIWKSMGFWSSFSHSELEGYPGNQTWLGKSPIYFSDFPRSTPPFDLGCAILMFDYRYPEILTFGYGKYDKYVGKSSIPGDLLHWE